MFRISVATRIALGLSCVVLSALLFVDALGLVRGPADAQEIARRQVCESLAIQACLAAQRNDQLAMQALLDNYRRRDASLRSAAVRDAAGRLVVDVGGHAARWTTGELAAENVQVSVPIFRGRQPWGTLEFCFAPLRPAGWLGWLRGDRTRLITIVTCIAFLSFLLYLRRILQYLDPSAVVPDRVRKTLDTLAEGVVILDQQQRIVLANEVFASTAGLAADALVGRRVSDLGVAPREDQPGQTRLPWETALDEGRPGARTIVTLRGGAAARSFAVSSSPIVGEDGRTRGALATFDDVTEIEERNSQLQQLLTAVNDSREAIRRQNEELQILATRDPLTGCLNRRAFFGRVDPLWESGLRAQASCGCVLLDIDHFKSINDNHGHSFGDTVLKHVAGILLQRVGGQGIVCRYGGEEFCVFVSAASLDTLAALAEDLRQGIAGTPCEGHAVTASLGYAVSADGARSVQELLDQADRALYYSKRTGRNRGTAWSAVPADFEIHEGTAHAGAAPLASASPVPYPAVSALISTLTYRDPMTGEHSRRVADHCVRLAQGLMTQSECYILEVAALLHDIGKIGVPDQILLKPGPLTAEEWSVMKVHDAIGVEILNAAFSCPQLTEIVEQHHAWFGGSPRDPELPTGYRICLGARILTICDAFDAMVSDRVYRKGRAAEEAYTELRRCAGAQFDPELVERFIEGHARESASRGAGIAAVPRQSALQIGLHLERLAAALDGGNATTIAAIASHLAATAEQEGVPEVAERARKVQQCTEDARQELELSRLTLELLEICRETQRSYVQVGDEAPRRPRAELVETGTPA